MNQGLRLSLQKDPLTLDPQKSGDEISSAVIFLLFRGLTRFEANQKVSCDLASSFYAMDNGKKYIFHLGKHSWSDGSPVTAHDFVYSWKRALSPNFPLRATNLFSYIKNGEKARKGLVSLDKVGVCAKDPFTLEVELEYPCPYFPQLTSFCSFFPVSSKTEEGRVFSLCNGPFRLIHWEEGKEILLEKNPLYTESEAIQLQEICFQILSDPKKAFDLFEKDQLDWLGDPISPLPQNYLPALLSEKRIRPIAGLVACWFNTTSPPFSDISLRKALASAIPRTNILQKLLLPNTLAAYRVSPPLVQGEKAKMVSEEKHPLPPLPKRTKLSLAFEATDELSRLASFLKSHWERHLEVPIVLEPLSFKELWQRLPYRSFEMCLFRSISQYTDILNFLERFESKNAPRNFSGWESAQYRSLLQKYRKTSNSEKRKDLAEKAEKLLLEEIPIVPIYYHHFTSLQKDRVKNLSISPIGVMQFDRAYLEVAESVSYHS